MSLSIRPSTWLSQAIYRRLRIYMRVNTNITVWLPRKLCLCDVKRLFFCLLRWCSVLLRSGEEVWRGRNLSSGDVELTVTSEFARISLHVTSWAVKFIAVVHAIAYMLFLDSYVKTFQNWHILEKKLTIADISIMWKKLHHFFLFEKKKKKFNAHENANFKMHEFRNAKLLRLQGVKFKVFNFKFQSTGTCSTDQLRTGPRIQLRIPRRPLKQLKKIQTPWRYKYAGSKEKKGNGF